MTAATEPLSVAAVRERFDAVVATTIGLEEEVMLLDPRTLDLAPRASELLALVDDETRVKPELPAAHVELVTTPATSVLHAIAQLAAARRGLARRAGDLVELAAAGVHPFANPLGQLSDDARYAHTRERFGRIAQLQLVCALQAHVAVGGADRTLAVHNALRAYLPEIAALAANAPFFAGSDSEMASVRPLLGRTLPRQGVPPVIESWESYVADLAWGAASDFMPSAGQWWWELRPHPLHGTLEVRVPDAQATVEHAGAVVAVVHCLVTSVARRVDAGTAEPPAPTWRIEENRWSAARHGVEGDMADLVTGEREPTRERLARLLAELEPVAAELECSSFLDVARELVETNGAMRLRAAAGADADTHAATRWLANVFVPAPRPSGGSSDG